MKGQCNPLLDLSARPVIAHRGASGEAPENTMPAFELAARQGADAFELDVRLTRDGVPVVLHDAALDRTTDRSALMAALTWQELGEVDAGYRFTTDRRSFPFRGRDVRVPRLVDVLRAFPGMPVLVELKEAAAQEAVRRVLLEERAVERCVLASEHHAALQLFREPPFATAASGAEIGALYRAAWLRMVPASVPYRCLSVPIRYRGLPVPTRRFIAAAGRLSCPVHVWTINEPATARLLWDRGVAGVVTNYPELVRATA
jgi:glycerophosphoryl diester phosphodiesterase